MLLMAGAANAAAALVDYDPSSAPTAFAVDDITTALQYRGYEVTRHDSRQRDASVFSGDYFRASVREMFRAYPLLRGIGLTTGENMGAISGDARTRRRTRSHPPRRTSTWVIANRRAIS